MSGAVTDHPLIRGRTFVTSHLDCLTISLVAIWSDRDDLLPFIGLCHNKNFLPGVLEPPTKTAGYA
ncbi:MAG: hypothetical protein JRC89_10045 [Deltaproteobacteria bacterium]|nr:hypothetical protein [Deltaproteobacteria bacterium]